LKTAKALKWNHAATGKPRILALGFGGAGIDLVTHLMDANLRNVHCVVVDSDLHHLEIAKAHAKLPIKAIDTVNDAPASQRDLKDHVSTGLSPLLEEADVAFVLAGMGGRTGSVIAPKAAETARRMRVLTIGLVTQPFQFERARFRPAIDGIRNMLNACDTTILLGNHLPGSSTASLPFRFSLDAPAQTSCAIVDSVSHTFTNALPSNAELGEFRLMLRRGGLARAGVGHSYSYLGTEEAALRALRNTMALGELTQADSVFLDIVGGSRVEHRHFVAALDLLSRKINPHAQFMYGHRVDAEMKCVTSATLIATGVSFPFTWGGYRSLPLNIFELEPDSPPEQSLELDLDLQQLESYAD